jgi:hypothetical protein
LGTTVLIIRNQGVKKRQIVVGYKEFILDLKGYYAIMEALPTSVEG